MLMLTALATTVIAALRVSDLLTKWAARREVMARRQRRMLSHLRPS